MTGRIAVLGAGIMGSCVALSLARRGVSVTLYDREARAVDRASRWNEGKLHLGYLYGADPSLATARHVLTGGLNFVPALSRLLSTDVARYATTGEDSYLVHPESVVSPDDLADLYGRIDALVREHPDAAHYPGDPSRARSRRLSRGELARLCDADRFVGGLAVPERSIDTRAIADLTCGALAAEPRIELRLATAVASAEPVEGPEGAWRVRGATDDVFDLVINCLWDGRMAIDATAGLMPEGEWSNRYRLALFVATSRDVDAACRVVAVGPFGDVKSYTARRFYISWYPAGLMLESGAVAPPDPRPFQPGTTDRIVAEVRERLGALLPDVREILDAAGEITCDGGFVFARGKGSLGDPASTLHRRDRFGVARRGNYLSVDTGKYSTAPWMAEQIAAEIAR